jgi:hypothetical protein
MSSAGCEYLSWLLSFLGFGALGVTNSAILSYNDNDQMNSKTIRWYALSNTVAIIILLIAFGLNYLNIHVQKKMLCRVKNRYSTEF